MDWYNDEDLLDDIVDLTAQFRYRICWAGARRLLEERGIAPLRCLLLSCDQGDDVNGTLLLPDGSLIDFDIREDPKTRELTSVSSWQPIEWENREVAVARRILSASDPSAFDRRILDYFKEHWMHRDAPLPPSA